MKKSEKDYKLSTSAGHISILDNNQKQLKVVRSDRTQSLDKLNPKNELVLPTIRQPQRPQPIARRMMESVMNKKNQLLLLQRSQQQSQRLFANAQIKSNTGKLEGFDT